VALAIEIVRRAIQKIKEPRFFRTERGYQGALISELRYLLQHTGAQLGNPIVEQEYQKRAREHGLQIRPDIIIHIPYERAVFNSRKEGNFVVIELKLRSSKEAAFNDFEKLERMCEVLGYPIGIFLNIDSNQLYLEEYLQEQERRRQYPRNYLLHEFSVRLERNTPLIQEYGSA